MDTDYSVADCFPADPLTKQAERLYTEVGQWFDQLIHQRAEQLANNYSNHGWFLPPEEQVNDYSELTADRLLNTVGATEHLVELGGWSVRYASAFESASDFARRRHLDDIYFYDTSYR